jgi:dGTPase
LLDQKPPLEAQLVDLVDEIAYNTADLDDGFEARLVNLDQVREAVPAFDSAYADVERKYPNGRRKLKFNEALKRVLNLLATDLIENTRRNVTERGVQTVEDIRRQPLRLAGFSSELAKQNGALKRFLNANLYSHASIAEERDRSVAALEALFRLFMEHPERMPAQYAEAAEQEARHRVVCDYVAGMTDHFLLRQAREVLGMATVQPC